MVFAHTLLGGETLDAEEITTALRDLSMLADEFDDRIVEEAGHSLYDGGVRDAVMKSIADLASKIGR